MSYGITWGKKGLVDRAARAAALGQGYASKFETQSRGWLGWSRFERRKQCEKAR